MRTETLEFNKFIEIVVAHGESLRLRDSEEFKNSKLFSVGDFLKFCLDNLVFYECLKCKKHFYAGLLDVILARETRPDLMEKEEYFC